LFVFLTLWRCDLKIINVFINYSWLILSNLGQYIYINPKKDHENGNLNRLSEPEKKRTTKEIKPNGIYAPNSLPRGVGRRRGEKEGARSGTWSRRRSQWNHV